VDACFGLSGKPYRDSLSRPRLGRASATGCGCLGGTAIQMHRQCHQSQHDTSSGCQETTGGQGGYGSAHWKGTNGGSGYEKSTRTTGSIGQDRQDQLGCRYCRLSGFGSEQCTKRKMWDTRKMQEDCCSRNCFTVQLRTRLLQRNATHSPLASLAL
jgi:hypothetical protein